MVIAEEESVNVKDSHDIDLKCAEKVTDSDNEENLDAGENKTGESTTSGGDGQSDNGRDVTCKPKPIKAQRQNIESPLLNYKQGPIYLNAYSPKNPTGILPFQPTGEQECQIPLSVEFLILFQMQKSWQFKKQSLFVDLIWLGGAFKTMPVSPKDVKPSIASGGSDVIGSENENQGDVKPTPPIVFTFTGAPITSSK